MKRKWISILLCVALSATLLAGCGGSKESAETEEASVVEEVTEETQEEPEEVTEEERNELSLTESEMEVIYSNMEEALRTEYLEPNNLGEEDFTFPEDLECWNYFAEYCMIRMEEPDSSKERIQGLCSGMYNVSSENQDIMTVAAESFYQSLEEMDELIAITYFPMSEMMVEFAQDFLISNVFSEGK